MYTIPPRGLKACICIIGGLELRSHLHADASAPSAVSFASTINLATRTMRTTRGSATSEASMVAEGHRGQGGGQARDPRVHLAAKLSRLSMRSVPSDSGSDGERSDRSVTDLREAGAVSAREAHGIPRGKGG